MSRKRRAIRRALGAAALVALAALALAVLILWRPRGERGPYLQSVTPTSVWVVWDTAQPAVGRVEYGPARGLGQVSRSASLPATMRCSWWGWSRTRPPTTAWTAAVWPAFARRPRRSRPSSALSCTATRAREP